MSNNINTNFVPVSLPVATAEVAATQSAQQAAAPVQVQAQAVPAQVPQDSFQVKISEAAVKANPAQLQSFEAGVRTNNTSSQREIKSIGLDALRGASTAGVQAKFGNFLDGLAKNGVPIDANALVQEVLREAYTQNTEDLRFYAEKVKFFNEMKKAIRDEVSGARKALSGLTKDTDTTTWQQKTFDANFTGLTDAQAAGLESMTSGKILTEDNSAALSGNGAAVVSKADCPAAVQAKMEANSIAIRTADGQFAIITPRPNSTGDYLDIRLLGADGKQLANIWGDPHVDTGTGQNWHFGEDSTFILPDGTKLLLDTEAWGGDGAMVIKNIHVMSGEDHITVNTKGQATAAKDRLDFDKNTADKKGDASSGVFAVQPDGNILGVADDGKLMNVASHDWNDYLKTKTVNVKGEASGATLSDAARQAVNSDRVANNQMTKTELEAYVKNLEEKLNSVGDDAQLANVDLQNMLQKQQQTLQTMSNISKMLHDTAMAVIRKIGG